MTYTRDDLIYMAGLFDGDGCVTLRLNSYNCGKSKRWTARIDITNTDGRIMYRLQDTFGGSVHTGSSNIYNHKTPYTWYLGARPNLKLVEDMYPFLSIKKIQVEILLAFIPLLGKAPFKITAENEEERMELIADLNDEKLKIYPYVRGV